MRAAEAVMEADADADADATPVSSSSSSSPSPSPPPLSNSAGTRCDSSPSSLREICGCCGDCCGCCCCWGCFCGVLTSSSFAATGAAPVAAAAVLRQLLGSGASGASAVAPRQVPVQETTITQSRQDNFITESDEGG